MSSSASAEPAPLIAEINSLRRSANAVILAHNYQIPEIQDIADFTGDSLQLSRRAAGTDADVIVFCGVHFMAETAAILCPGKKVLIPDPEAGCPMADMITAEELRRMKSEHPGAKTVCYVNSTAEVKAESDVCCTSSNATAVVESLSESEEIIFVPDGNLGEHVRDKTGRPLLLWPGYCPTHVAITPGAILAVRNAHPDAVVIVHPECPAPVRKTADEILSTGGMLKFARSSPKKEFIVGTESGLLYTLEKANPGKLFYGMPEPAVCADMKRITLEKVRASLAEKRCEVNVPEHTARGARKAVERMLSVA
ncbi:MAG: quinolinate synthase NadA [Kiritimatiellia bacterium]